MSAPRARRRRFLRRHHRPDPLVVRVANCASVSTRPAKAEDTFRRALTTPGKYGLPDVVLCQEMADVDAKKVAHQVDDGWQAEQHGAVGSPESGLAIAWRHDRARRVSSVLLPGTPAAEHIRRRPILIDQLQIDRSKPTSWRTRFASGHAAPARAPQDRARFLTLFDQIRVRIRGGDLNVIGHVVARLFGRRVFTIGVLHLIVSRWIPAEGPAPVDHGSDHKGVDVLLWP